MRGQGLADMKFRPNSCLPWSSAIFLLGSAHHRRWCTGPALSWVIQGGEEDVLSALWI